jgi:hypothetical protein
MELQSIKEDEIGGTCSMHAEMNSYVILDQKPDVKRPFEAWWTGSKSEGNSNIESLRSFGCHKMEFLDQVSNYQLFKTSCTVEFQNCILGACDTEMNCVMPLMLPASARQQAVWVDLTSFWKSR